MFNPASAALWNLNMYGGIALFSAFVLFDTAGFLESTAGFRICSS